MVHLLTLPLDILLKILDKLSMTDRKSVVLVCLLMSRVGSHPSLWSQVKVSRTAASHSLANILKCNRLSQLSCLNFSNFKSPLDLTALLNFLNKTVRLFKLDLSSCDLSSAPAYPLATGLARCELVSISQTRLSSEQVTAIIGKLTSSKQHMSYLDISFNDLSYTDPDMLGQAIGRLTKANLAYTELTTFQVKELGECLANSNSLSDLDLSGGDISGTDLDCVGLNQCLSSLALTDMRLSSQPDHLMTNLSLVGHLTSLSLSQTVLTSTSPLLLADLVTMVNTVDLNFCWLYTEHIEFILAGIGDQSKIKNLNMSGNHMEEVSGDLVVEAINYLDMIRLEWSNLTDEHLELLIDDTNHLEDKKIVLNHYELINNHLEIHRKSKYNSNINLSMETK